MTNSSPPFGSDADCYKEQRSKHPLSVRVIDRRNIPSLC